MPNGRITTQDIEALVDGQLDPEAANRLHSVIRRQPLLQRHYRQLVLQKQLLHRWWATQSRLDNRG